MAKLPETILDMSERLPGLQIPAGSGQEGNHPTTPAAVRVLHYPWDWKTKWQIELETMLSR